MRTTSMRASAVAAGLMALVTLAGCGSSSYGGGSAAATRSSAAATAKADLNTADTSLGKVVVDSAGRTVYVFDKDTPGAGTSECTAACLTKWSPVPAPSATPAADGIMGKLGTITRDDGSKQVTLAGMPLYLFNDDSHAGDVRGQGFLGIWWVVSPEGTKITATAASSSAAPPPGTGY